MRMRRPRLIRSVYARAILQLTLAILVAFVVLGLVYYRMVTANTTRQQANQLIGSARAISDVVAAGLDLSGEISDPRLVHYINFSARSTGAFVWIINQHGELVVNTGMPQDAARELDISERGYYQLPPRYLAAMGSGTSGTSQIGDFGGLFRNSGVRWLSAAYPLAAAAGGYRGEIQLHMPLGSNGLGSFLMTNGLIVSFLVAFAIALLFIGILSHNITRPIRLLSEAADKVSRGNLSARVILPGIDNLRHPDTNDTLVTDDLTILVNTMNTMIERLERQDAERKEFMSSVSHDLRTPITSIAGFVEGMLDGTIPAQNHAHYLEIVKQETHRLQNLVKTMFESSLFSEKAELNMTVFDINELIKEDVIGLESLLAEKNLSVQTDFLEEDDGRLMVIGDREAISRVIYNILANAIRFTPQDGVIALTTRFAPHTRQIEVVIDDNGPGIPENETNYVFDRFYKVDKSRTAAGSGLGLYICRTILAAHGQKIYAARSDMGGARFVFTMARP